MAFWTFPPNYLTHLTDKTLTDATFRALNPAAERMLRVATMEQLAHLDPAIGSLTGDDAELAAAEIARVDYELFRNGLTKDVAVVILEGAFPTEPRENIIARARLQALRDAGVTHAFVQFADADPRPLWVIMKEPPFGPPPSYAPPRMVLRQPHGFRRERTPRWIR